MDYLALLAICIALFARFLLCDYVVDDDQRVKYMTEFKRELKSKKPREILFEALYGAGIFAKPWQEYLFTIGLHFVNCALILNLSGSLLAAVLYLCNPVNNQTAVWLNGRRYAISLFLILLGWKFQAVFLLAYAVGVFLHVSIVAMPALLLFSSFWPLLPSAGGILAVVGYPRFKARYYRRKKDFTVGNINQRLEWRKAILYVKSLGYFFFHSLFPKPHMYHKFLYYFSLTEQGNRDAYRLFSWDFLKGILVAGYIGFEIIYSHNFWAFWWLLFISQYCNVLTVTQNASDRYCSIANVGLMVLVSQWLALLPSDYRIVVVSCLLTFYVLRYVRLYKAYDSIENFYVYNVESAPDVPKSRSLLAKMYLSHRDACSAYATLKQGLRYFPNDFKMLLDMSSVMFALGQMDKGQKLLDFASNHVYLGEEEETKVEIAKLKADIRFSSERFAPRSTDKDEIQVSPAARKKIMKIIKREKRA